MATPNPTPENHTGQPAAWAITYCPERDRFLIPKALNTMSAVYLVKNTVTGRRYVGSSATVGKRVAVHVNRTSSNRVIAEDMIRHGRRSFLVSILEVVSREMLRQREQFWIAEIRPECNMHYFVGSTGRQFSEETRAKLSEVNARRRHSDETKAKIGQAQIGREGTWTGKKRPDETRARMSAAKKGKPLHPANLEAIRASHANRRAHRGATGAWLIAIMLHYGAISEK